MTTGAANDIEQATSLARSMVTRFGMSKKFGLIGLESIESQYLDGRAVLNCSDATAALIDEEVMNILKECYQEALELLSANREVMDKLAAFLIEKETITGKEFMKIYRELKGLPEPEEKEDGQKPDQSAAQHSPQAAEERKTQPRTIAGQVIEEQQTSEQQNDSKQESEEKKPWAPPAPGPEAQPRGPVGKFSGAPLEDEEKRQ